MKTLSEIEDLLLGHTYEETYTWDYDGYKDYRTGEIRNAHKKGDKYTVDMDSWYMWAEGGDPLTVPGLGVVYHVDNFGGEGMGDSLWLVLCIEPEDGSDAYYVRKSGYYASFSGGEWDGELEFVQPAEKTVTVYETV